MAFGFLRQAAKPAPRPVVEATHEVADRSLPLRIVENERARRLTRAISLDSADHLDRAIDIVQAGLRDRERIERQTARLALEVAAADRVWHEELDSLYDDMNAYANEPHDLVATRPTRKLLKLAQHVAIGGAIAAIGAGCECGMVVDPVPQDAGNDAGMVVDPAPFDVPAIALAGMAEDGRPRPWHTAAGALRHPGQVPGLLVLFGHYRASMRTLKRAAATLSR